MRAMGGEEKLRALRGIRLEGSGHTYDMGESERPEGPWLVIYFQFDEYADFEKGALRRSRESRSVPSAEWRKSTTVLAGGVVANLNGDKSTAADLAKKDAGEERLALGPERVLLNALAARDLEDEGDVVLQRVPHHVVHFTLQGRRIRIFFNGETGLPTAVDWVAACRDLFWGVWGDVSTRVLFSAWDLLPGGFRYPRQWDTERNGVAWQSIGIGRIEFDPPRDDAAFAISDDVARAFPARSPSTIDEGPLGTAERPPQVLAEGIVEIPGFWNVTLVRQPDGVVVLEGPIASSYSAKVLAEVKRRFPGVPVKAVISTSDAWPHIGGLREYVAEGIPIYVLDRNEPLVSRLLSAPHRIAPDKLALHPREPKWHLVSRKETLGEGDNRMDLYPIHTENGERMIMVHFPAHRVLYASDIVQTIQPDGSFFFPGFLLEITEAVARENITVERVFAMHLGATPWERIVAAVQKARAGGR